MDLKIANSWWMYLLGIVVVVFVLVGCLFFIYRAYKEAKEKFEKLAIYDNPGRIAAFRDGSIWRMVIVVYSYDFPEEPQMRISKESKELRFFSKEEIAGIEIAVTHRDIVEELFLKK